MQHKDNSIFISLKNPKEMNDEQSGFAKSRIGVLLDSKAVIIIN